MPIFISLDESPSRGRYVRLKAARATISPAGGGLVLPTPGTVPTITDVGISVAKPIELDDPLARLAVTPVK
jgi:hypothetical protein